MDRKNVTIREDQSEWLDGNGVVLSKVVQSSIDDKVIYESFDKSGHGNSLVERFVDKVEMENGIDSCWLWEGATTKQGYGCIYVDETTQDAHRVGMMLNGVEVDGHTMNHHCDVKNCVNPDHIYVGTYSENLKDAHERGRRTSRHEANGNVELSVSEVKEIKQRLDGNETQKEIADDYSVSESCISNISTGHTWEDIEV